MTSVSPSNTRLLTWTAALVLAAASFWAYRGTFHAPFFFDDLPAIVNNPSIRDLGDLGGVLSPPSDGGNGVGSRPIVNLSFAINYALGGTEVEGYHAFNLGIHVLAGLVLLGLVRRTLEARKDAASLPLAVGIAAVWLLHPLQTESVTCVVQRTESLMGLFYLLSLYAFIRGAAHSSRGWFAVAILTCWLGMATKETMVTAPVVILLYDRTFLAGNFIEVWRRRRGIYIGLGASWLLLSALLLQGGGSRGQAAGFGLGVTPWTYALTQAQAIVHYLKLAFWPSPLVVDYGTSLISDPVQVLPQACLLILLVLASIAGFFSRSPAKRSAGFLGVSFFLLLSPSSSVVPLVTQTIAEHRMYLPLASVIALVLCGAWRWMERIAPAGAKGRIGAAALVILAVGLGTATAARNADYGSVIRIWTDTVAKVPENARAHTNLGEALRKEGRTEAAVKECEEAIRLEPALAEAHNDLGDALVQEGHVREAGREYETALRLKPDYLEAHNNLGNVLVQEGETGDAMAQFQAALRIDPSSESTHYNLGLAHAKAGDTTAAIEQYRTALKLDPNDAAAHNSLGISLSRSGRLPEAAQQFQAAIRINPKDMEPHNNLGGVFAQLGRLPEAIEQFSQAVRLRPDYVGAHLNLGLALRQAGRTDEANAQFAAAAQLQGAPPGGSPQ